MGSVVYGMVNQIIGDGLSTKLDGWMANLTKAVSEIFTMLQSSGIIGALSGIACSLMIIYFFMDLTSQASRDMFSFEKLVVAFIKLLVAFAILLYVGEIVEVVIKMLDLFRGLMLTVEIKSSGGSTALDAASLYDKEFGGILGAIKGIGAILILVIPWLISWVCEIVGMFLTASTMLQFLARAILSPLAIVQCFEDGTRSSGIRYIKGLFAESMSLGTMLLILRMAAALGNKMVELQGGKLTDIFAQPAQILTMGIGDFSILIITSLLCVGGMAGASKITHDVMGA